MRAEYRAYLREAPLYFTEFRNVEPDALPMPLDDLKRITDENSALNWSGVNFEVAKPVFYPGCHFIWLHCADWVSDRFVFLARSGQSVRLRGTSDPVHMINVTDFAMPSIDEPNGEEAILAYLEYFCFAVRGELGPFHILTERDLNPAVTYHNNAEPRGHAIIARLSDLYRPSKVWGRDRDGKVRVSALVWYSKTMFFADFVINPNGFIEMLDDFPVKELGVDVGHPPLADTPLDERKDLPSVPGVSPYLVAEDVARRKRLKAAVLQLLDDLENDISIDQENGGAASVTVNGFGDILSIEIAHRSLSDVENADLGHMLTRLIKKAMSDRRYSSYLAERAILSRHNIEWDEDLFKRVTKRYGDYEN